MTRRNDSEGSMLDRPAASNSIIAPNVAFAPAIARRPRPAPPREASENRSNCTGPGEAPNATPRPKAATVTERSTRLGQPKLGELDGRLVGCLGKQDALALAERLDLGGGQAEHRSLDQRRVRDREPAFVLGDGVQERRDDAGHRER